MEVTPTIQIAHTKECVGMSASPPAPAASTVAVADEDWTNKPRTPMGRLVPAVLLSQIGFYVAVLTPIQLLLTLHLTSLAGGGDATGAFGIVTGFGALVALLFNPIAGRISDRTRLKFGRRRTWILFGALSGAIALVAISATTEVWQVVVLWCVVQACFNFQFAANNALVADQVPPGRRGGISGLVGLTLAAGPLLGLAVANSVEPGSALQWQAIAAVAVVVAVVAVLLVRDFPAGARPDPQRRSGVAGVFQTFWINPMRHPAFGWAWAVRFLATCAYAGTSYYAFFLLQRFGISAEEVGAIVLNISVISIVLLAGASVGAGYLSDAVKRQKPFVIVGGIIASSGLVLMAFAPSITMVYVAAALVALGTGAFFAIDLALCIRVLPNSADAGRDLAIINIANSLPQSLVPFIAPVLLLIGGYVALFGFLALLGILGSVAVLRIPEIGQEHSASRWTVPITRHNAMDSTSA
ncbi:MFS transporter [Tessaracoccus palaemonis]|uniref:MFS transporter n=1 Tax=Tessaracoccus palaemonis TaxID=2829499 RepID=A0ABX8SL29_9ACTN|nr:MFS transporter [Tessaracoccus palaemonis]QXT62868.1 MFS transporter [Tessaracoccus palaemonis]